MKSLDRYISSNNNQDIIVYAANEYDAMIQAERIIAYNYNKELNS